MKSKNVGSESTTKNNSQHKISDSNSERRSLIDSMKESVGPMDCTYGYSVKKLASYFEKEYPPEILRTNIALESTEKIPDRYLFGLVSEVLIAFDKFQDGVIRRFTGFFDRFQLAVIFQFFNGIAFDYKDLNISEPYFDFRNRLESFIEDPENEDATFMDLHEKMYDVDCIEFYLLGLLIIEDWHTQFSTSNKHLFRILLEDSGEDSLIKHSTTIFTNQITNLDSDDNKEMFKEESGEHGKTWEQEFEQMKEEIMDFVRDEAGLTLGGMSPFDFIDEDVNEADLLDFMDENYDDIMENLIDFVRENL